MSADTGFVGIRCPAHPIAQALLKEARVPVAAPSANRFGHVSPTSAQHVMDDLGLCAISIIDDANETCCQVGIESTVAKIVPEDHTIVLFRRGGVSEDALRAVLARDRALLGGDYQVVAIQKQAAKDDVAEAHQAPGQSLTHYAPDVDTYLYQDTAVEAFGLENEDVASWVVLDFGGRLAALQDRVLAYADLSATGDVAEASHNIFDLLRWSENVQGVKVSPCSTRLLVVHALSILISPCVCSG